MRTTDIAWLAGLLEGEGSFLRATNRPAPKVQVAMTDRDVVKRVARLFKNNSGLRPHRARPDRKIVYHAYAYGPRAAGLMMTLYSFMGQRRRAKIREVLSQWRTWKDRRFGPCTEVRRQAVIRGKRLAKEANGQEAIRGL